MFNNLSVNIPLVDAFYVDSMTDFVTEKIIMDFKVVKILHSYSEILTSNVVIKNKYTGAFIFLVTLGYINFVRLCVTWEKV